MKYNKKLNELPSSLMKGQLNAKQEFLQFCKDTGIVGNHLGFRSTTIIINEFVIDKIIWAIRSFGFKLKFQFSFI